MQKDIQSPEEFSRLYPERIELVRQAMLEAMGRVLAAAPVVDGLKTRSIMEVNAGKWYSGRIMLRACIADFLAADVSVEPVWELIDCCGCMDGAVMESGHTEADRLLFVERASEHLEKLNGWVSTIAQGNLGTSAPSP